MFGEDSFDGMDVCMHLCEPGLDVCMHLCELAAKGEGTWNVVVDSLWTGGPSPDPSSSEDSPHSRRSGLTRLPPSAPRPLASAD